MTKFNKVKCKLRGKKRVQINYEEHHLLISCSLIQCSSIDFNSNMQIHLNLQTAIPYNIGCTGANFTTFFKVRTYPKALIPN